MALLRISSTCRWCSNSDQYLHIFNTMLLLYNIHTKYTRTLSVMCFTNAISAPTSGQNNEFREELQNQTHLNQTELSPFRPARFFMSMFRRISIAFLEFADSSSSSSGQGMSERMDSEAVKEVAH